MDPTTETIRHFIDHPPQWTDLPPCLVIRGWVFAIEGDAIQNIRLRTAGLSFFGMLDLPRPDVRAAFPETPDDNTGFALHCVLPPGGHDLRLEVQLADGRWQLVRQQPCTVRRRWLPLWLRGGLQELLFTQMPCHMIHPPRALAAGSLPAPTTPPDRLPKLSIVTPSYQQARYLPETLRSVLGQRGVNCEYVVQDGGSTDGSVELIRASAAATPVQPHDEPRSAAGHPPRLLAWESTPDHGQADAIMKGFAKTSGAANDVMAWLNSDDYYLPGALAFVADFFARHPDVDVVYGHRILVDEHSQEIGRWHLPPHSDAVLRLFDFVPQETLFWRRGAWAKAGGLDPSLQFAMDWDLLLKFQKAGARLVRLPAFLSCFRIHPRQKTSAKMHASGQGEIDQLRRQANARNIPEDELAANPHLLRYLRQSAWIRFLSETGLRSH